MNDKTNLRIETVNEYCIVDKDNQIVKDGFCSEEEAAKWLEDIYGIKHEPKPQSKIVGWIPCSERLPKRNGEYMCTQEIYSLSNGKILGRSVEMIEFYNGEWKRARNLKVVAWKPKPEPYYG